MHTGAQLLISQFQLLFEVAQLSLKIGILGLEFAEEQRGLSSVVIIFGGRRRCVRAIIVAFQRLVA